LVSTETPKVGASVSSAKAVKVGAPARLWHFEHSRSYENDSRDCRSAHDVPSLLQPASPAKSTCSLTFSTSHMSEEADDLQEEQESMANENRWLDELLQWTGPARALPVANEDFIARTP
jgi:hypothetical protein